MTAADIKDLLPLIIPIIIIQVVIMVIALVDLSKRKRVKGESKVVWALIIILVNLIGPVIYLLWGRHPDSGQEEDRNDSGYTN